MASLLPPPLGLLGCLAAVEKFSQGGLDGCRFSRRELLASKPFLKPCQQLRVDVNAQQFLESCHGAHAMTHTRVGGKCQGVT